MTVAVIEGTFTTREESPPVTLHRHFNISLVGPFRGTVELQRSFDRGVTWRTVEQLSQPGEHVRLEPETFVLYRLTCTSLDEGEVSYRLSQ